ncbi:DHA2 family efflux MFS transporter permease subunit [Mucilaginibacter sp. BJC16-A38]|uniref:DHA2 family efflux MFS transporter permease subunit n=1 Tax=Mucilaginibacter phenanthrenivorans TaxID=1234842 RepID=UPI002157E179|nr:DHA2 family efflux MFS transporter permease subunit [Mucilaginibacter phenanthrenivorans]MCR8557345.1 DHA2 family efflux MFS transporter permease subunit [Mucilaginibacter phenanthrenivorans]
METGFRKWIIVVTIVAATVIELIDTTIVNVSINTMSGNLGASLEDTAWVITAYAIANVIIIPMTSFLAEKIGRKTYYIGSVLLFTIASVLCGLSNNLWELVAFRFIQGIGGGALLSTSQAILFETFPPKERGTASGIFSLGIIIGPSIGPLIGGYIVDNLSWPWIFYVNIPIGLLAASLAWIYLRPTKAAVNDRKIDLLGIGLLAVGIGSLQIVLERGQTDDWFSAGYIVVLSVISALCLTLLIWWELRTKFPVINLRVLKNSTLSLSLMLNFALGFGLFSSIFVFPLLAQRITGFSAFQTGLMLLPGTVMAALISPFLGKMLQSGIRPQILIVSGFLLCGVFTFMMSGTNQSAGPAYYFIPLVFRGLGTALLLVPLTSLAVSALKPQEIPQGAALSNMSRQLGGSFGIALINTYIAHRAAWNRLSLITHITGEDPQTADRLQSLKNYFLTHGATLQHAYQEAIGALELTVRKQTFLLSYLDAFLLLSMVNFCCIPLVLLTIKKKRMAPAINIAVKEQEH